MPRELTPLAVARSLGVLPSAVLAMPEDDVLDQLQWMRVEGAASAKAAAEAERKRSRGW